MSRLILIGSGGHALSIADTLARTGVRPDGCINEVNDLALPGVPLLGRSLEDIPDVRDCRFFIAFGDNENRRRWFETLRGLDLPLVNIIDPTALISDSAVLGCGVFVGKYAVINAGAVIGDDAIVNTRAIVEHECRVGSHVHLSTGSILNGKAVAEDLVFFGSGAVCNDKVRIGREAVVGSGSVVIRDIPPAVTAVGNPARIIKSRQGL